MCHPVRTYQFQGRSILSGIGYDDGRRGFPLHLPLLPGRANEIEHTACKFPMFSGRDDGSQYRVTHVLGKNLPVDLDLGYSAILTEQ